MTSLVSQVTGYFPSVEGLLGLSRRYPTLSKCTTIALSLLLVRLVAKALKKRVPRHTILEIDLDEKIREQPAKFKFMGTHSLHEVIETIDKARTDSRVSALLVKIKTPEMTLLLPQVQELREAVKRFRAAGKIAVAYADTFGEYSNATSAYYLASAFSYIYVQPSGVVGLAGPSLDVPFIKGTLEKIGVIPEVGQRKNYKSAVYTFTQDKFVPEHREMMESLIGEYFNQHVSGIAEGRRISEDLVKSKMLHGIHSSLSALDGLVDGARYQDEVYHTIADLLKISKSKANFLFWHKYMAKIGGKYSKKSKNSIALIYATGNIMRGVDDSRFHEESSSIRSDSICATIRAAAKDKKVKAIVIRVDSRGGSYIASDTIYHEILLAKNAGKKVVVSMGNFAASGGYFIAMPADRIVAQPATLTGSIGVFFGKLVTRDMWHKLGITHDNAKIPVNHEEGIYNDWYSSLHSYKTEEDIKKREEILDYIYDDFTKKVGISRKLTRDQVEAVAQGRVWTGSQAIERGLVDKIGGLEDAIELAKELADIPATATPFVQIFPKKFVMSFIKPAKNREESDSYGKAFIGMPSGVGNFMDNVALLSTLAAPFSSLIQSHTSEGVALPLAAPAASFL